jgi:UPF0716 protein FxsA
MLVNRAAMSFSLAAPLHSHSFDSVTSCFGLSWEFDVFARLLLLFILVPLADLMLLLMIADWTHWTTTILLVIISGIIGAWLAKQQSVRVGMKIRDQLARNEVPSGLLTDGAMILFAAGLLVTPGVITDIFGLSLLVPQARNWYKQRVWKWLKNHYHVQVTEMKSREFDSRIVEGEVVGPHTRPKSEVHELNTR